MSASPKLNNLVPFDEKNEATVETHPPSPASAFSPPRPSPVLRLASKPPAAPVSPAQPLTPFQDDAGEPAVEGTTIGSPPVAAVPAPADASRGISPDAAFEQNAAEDLTGEVIAPPRRGFDWRAWVDHGQQRVVDLYDRFQFLPSHIKRAVYVGSASVGVLTTGLLVVPHHQAPPPRPLPPPVVQHRPPPPPVAQVQVAPKPVVVAPPPQKVAVKPAPIAKPVAKPVAKATKPKVGKTALKKKAAAKKVAKKTKKGSKKKVAKSKAKNKKSKHAKLAKSKAAAKAKKVAATNTDDSN